MKKAKKVFMKILIYITLLVTLFVVAYRYIDPALFTLIRANQNTVPKIFLFLGKDPNMINKKNASLLSQACFSNNKDMVKFLIDKGADPDMKVVGDFTPIYIAAQQKNYDIVKCLIKNGVDINNKITNKKLSILMIVVKNGDLDMTKYLISEGADVNQYDKNCWTPVSYASYYNKNEILDFLLLQNGRKEDIKKKWPEIVRAAYNGNIKQINNFISASIDVNTMNYLGRSALHYASERGNIELVEILINNGADVNLKDKNGVTPLMEASEKNVELVKSLLNAGADVNLYSNYRKNALIYAVEKDRGDIVKFLLGNGADTSIMTKSGRNAFDYVKRKNKDLKEILRDKNDIVQFDNVKVTNDFEDYKYEWLYPYPNGNDLNAICKIPGTNKIVAAGRSSTIMTYDTVKGTVEVNSDLIGLDESISKIHFLDRNTGYALLGSNKLIRTIDGGRSWQWGNINIHGNASDLYFKGKRGFIIGNFDTIIRLDTKTGKWILCNENFTGKYEWNVNLRDIYIDDKGFGLVVGSKGAVFSTNDHGISWNKYDKIKTENDLIRIAFADSKNGYVIGQKDVLFSTIDGGKSWESEFKEDDKYKATYVEKTYNDLFFIDNNVGYRKEYPGGLKKSIDKGKTWFALDEVTLPNKSLFEDELVYGLKKNTLIVSKDEGKTWSSVNEEVMDGSILVDYIDDTNIYGMVNKTRFLRSNDHGETWKTEDIKGVFDIYFIDSSKGYMLYSNNFNKYKNYNQGWGSESHFDLHIGLKSTDDGGETWNLVESDLNEVVEDELVFRLNSRYNQSENMYFFNSEIGFLFCYGAILRTIDGGKTWKEDNTNTIWKNLTNSDKITNTKTFYFVNEKTGFRTDANGAIYKTVDGGSNWKQVFKSNLIINKHDHIAFNSIDFIDENLGFAVGNFESICRTEDGGNTWELIKNTKYSNNYDKIYFHDKMRGIIVGDYIYVTSNGGRNWVTTWNRTSYFTKSAAYYNGKDKIIIADDHDGIQKITWRNDE
ncbi:MAG: ankyrin repeat domain-containing protein [Candidatus Delongbacteria bacterium]|jgi:ankyrin repeat protein/photosystem II stability/assembly factor-like uncharacterized protein|nr:ankyrin repeat domain-containing protein [Candidatus Delongbacteria bacterium]